MPQGEAEHPNAPAARPSTGPANLALSVLLALCLVVSGCSIPLGVRDMQVGTREDKKVLDSRVNADIRVENGSVAVVRVSSEQRMQVETLAIYHRMAVQKDLTLLVLGSIGVVATAFILLLIASGGSDSGGGGGSWDD